MGLSKMQSFLRLSRRLLTLVGAAMLLLAAGFVLSSCQGEGNQPGGMGPVQVIVEEAKKEAVEEKVSVVGTLAANEVVEIQSETEGKVEGIEFEEGQEVKKETLLFTVDRKKLTATVAQAEANFQLSQANLKRSEALFKNKTISSQEYDQTLSSFRAMQAALDLTKQELEDATIVAPFDGIMGARLISPGQLVRKGTALSSIVNVNPLKAEFRVPERYAGQLRPNLGVRIRVAAFPDNSFQGKVYFVSPRVDELTRTVLVKAEVPNEERRLKPGMLANVDIVLAVRENAVVVPESALELQGEMVRVYVVSPEKTAESREVRVGRQLKGKVEIVEGVTAGELVVAEGVQKVRPGVPLAFSTEQMNEAEQGK